MQTLRLLEIDNTLDTQEAGNEQILSYHGLKTLQKLKYDALLYTLTSEEQERLRNGEIVNKTLTLPSGRVISANISPV